MHYKMREDKREELLEGRTLTYVAKKCNFARQYVSQILNQERIIPNKCATKIIINLSKDSVRISTLIKENGFDDTLNYFFENVE